jgi:GT2 family glycosyltransferase/MoaA/NifB/PqqE/SkfB family radical SAM enzyme
MSGPLVDIIVTTRDNAPVLREALVSVEKQTFSNYRCYVVDDCSTDDTAAMAAREFPWVQFIESPMRSGPSKNRNRAIAMGSAPFVVTLDDDVVLTPDWLREMIDFISFSSSIGAVGSQLRYWQYPDRLNGIGGFLSGDGFGGDLFFDVDLSEVKGVIEQPMRILYACSAAMIMRREAFEKVGRFDPAYFYLAEDLDLGIRMNFCGYLVVYNPKAVAYHRYHTTARRLSPGYVDYLYHRNSFLTLWKNFSFTAVAVMLPGFFFRLLSYPIIALKVLGWHLLHLMRVVSLRRSIRERRIVDETEILSVNAAILALRPRGVGLTKPQGRVQPWNRRLLRKLFRSYVSVLEKLGSNHRERGEQDQRYVDHIIFQVTNICNAQCKQCFVLHQLNKDVQKNLSLNEIEKFFTSLGRVRNIVLGGGEPFLRKDLDQVCASLDKISKPELITVPTNGAYPEIISRKVQSILEKTRTSLKISLSLDGLPETHDEIRRVPGLFANVKEAYDRLEFLYYLFFPRLSLQVNTTVFADNYEQFSQVFSLVKEQFPLAGFTFEAIRGHYDENLCQPVSDATYQALVDSVREVEDIRASGQLELHELALETIRRQTQVVPCIGGADFIVLDFFGNLYPCEILPSVINIRDINYDFRRVLEDSRWTKAVEDIQNAKCHCTHMCFLSSSLDEVKKQGQKAALPKPRVDAMP